MRVRRIVALGVVVATLAAIAAIAEPAWERISTRREESRITRNGHALRGWKSYWRWGEKPVAHGRDVYYFEESGFVAGDSYWSHGEWLGGTNWNPDGTVRSQLRTRDEYGNVLDDPGEFRGSAPWWWDARDQSAPSAPFDAPAVERKAVDRKAVEPKGTAETTRRSPASR